MKVIRKITYEGSFEWLKETLTHSLPDGHFGQIFVETLENPDELPRSEFGCKIFPNEGRILLVTEAK